MNLQKKSIVVLLILSLVTVSTVHARNKSEALAGIGFIGFWFSMLYDIISAPAAARSYNRELAGISIDYRRYVAQWVYAEKHPFGKPEFRKSLILKNGHYFPPVFANLQPEKRKSEAAAFFLSLGATAVPLAIGATIIDHSARNGGSGANILFGAGFFVGPAVGHFYAHRPVRAIAGTFLRVGFATLFLTNFEYIDD